MAVAFQQQGSLDWTSLATNSGIFSIQLFQRVSAANVDLYTILVAHNVCGRLLCGSEGRKRFMKALQSCSGLAGYRNILWFGFGIKHIASALVATEQGTMCAALCSCLAECYTTDYAAEILMEMSMVSLPADEEQPSLLQWHDLVNSCAGLVAKSTFALRAEQMMRLVGESRIASPNRQFAVHLYTSERGTADKTDIAKTLLGLGKLSKKSLFQMTIVGGADAGFVAAIADWLLDLRVEIRGRKDTESACEETLFRSNNCHPNDQPQLLVIYQKNVAGDSIHCEGQTYRLPDARQVIRREDGSPRHNGLTGRVSWEKALEHTFNRDFKRLMDLGEVFGDAIGSAAGVFQALCDADERFPQECFRDCRTYFPDSHGPAYVHFVLSRFPELEPLRDYMYSAARSQEPWASFSTDINTIATGCACQECCPTEMKDGGAPPRAGFCLVYLTYSVIITARALSGMITDICPMRAGLEAMYWSINRKSLLSPIIEFNDTTWHTGVGTKVLLQAADTIFGGDSIAKFTGYKDWICAIAENGLCYYFDLLVAPSFGAARAARVHITPGRIEHQGRGYNILRDVGHDSPPHSGSNGIDEKSWSRFQQALTKGRGGQPEILVEERLDGLSIHYGVIKDSDLCYTFGPARAVHSMCRNEGRISTCHGKCIIPAQFKEIREAVGMCIEKEESLCLYRFTGAQAEHLFVLGDTPTCLGASTEMWDPIIQRHECLACCVRYALSLGLARATIILSEECVAAMRRPETAPPLSGVNEITV